MEEDTEVLDWGHEDDEQHHEHRFSQQTALMDDPEEDAVSLGGDEDDVEHYYAYQSSSNHDGAQESFTASKGLPVAASQQQQQQQQQQVSQGNHEHQRDHSGNSHKPNSQSQPSPKQPSPKRSQSFGKMMHSLPPKPVLSSIPFLQPTHPSSIIEATAMSGSLPREKKPNGSAGKPLSPNGTGDSLPPDWELKQARSGNGVYYYNVRTHQSTWSRPVSGARSPVKDKERGRTQTLESRSSMRSGNSSPNQLRASRTGRSEEPQAIVPPALSYDDRHYRPGDSAQVSGVAEKRREERFDSNIQRRSLTPPRSPRILSPSLPLRPPSPTGRGRDDKRNSRSHRKSSPTTTGELGTLKDPQREKSRATAPRVSSPDRHWVAPEDPPPRKSSGRRPPPTDHHHRQHEDVVDMPSPPATPVNNEDRNSSGSGFRNDAEWSSTLRHRSPPPHIRENNATPAAQTSRAGDSGPPPQATPRARSRFDQPANKSPKISRAQPTHGDIYIPDDLLPVRRDEEPRLTFTQAGGTENDTTRRRAHDRATGTSSRRAAAQVEPALVPAPPSLNERSASASSLSPAAGEQSRSKRVPLPPQSMRFQMSKRPSSKPDPPPPAPQVVQTAPNDGGMMQNSTNAEHSLPSGPRHQPQQIVSSRDANQVEPRKGSRLPPSGPSAGSATLRHRRSEPVFPASQLMVTRDRNVMEVDSAPAPRPPALRINDTTIRANSGMYADREPQRVEVVTSTDAAPRGPRAMTNRMPSSSSHISLTSSTSTSPTTPMYSQRSAAPQEFPGSKLRGRSPPPHLAGNNGFQGRDRPSARFSQADGATLRPSMPARRVSNASDRGPLPQGHYQMGDQQPPRRELVNSQPRQDLFLHVPPPAPRGFSGSNSIPIGSRKGPNTGPLPQGMPSQSASNSRLVPVGVNVESARSRPTHVDLQRQNTYEAPASSPVDRYNLLERNDTSRRRAPSGHMTSHHPLSPIDSFQTSTASGRSRRDTWHPPVDVSQPVSRAPQEPEPRTWTPRQEVQHPPSYERIDNDFSAATPPPLSREPSWDAAERHRSASQYQGGRSQLNNQYEVTVHHDAVEDMESRHRRQPEVEIDRKRGRVPHSAPTHRSSGSHDSRPVQMSLDRYEEETYRPRDPPSPTMHRRRDSFSGHASYPNEAHHQSFSDDRRVPDAIAERQVQSWDREFEAEHHSSNVNHDPYSMKIVRSRRPGSQAVPEYAGYPRHYETADGWQHADELTSSAPTVHRRPEPSRRGGSLLDRLSLDNGANTSIMSPQSLRDRVQVPSKRDREDIGNDSTGDIDMEDVGGPSDSASKRPRRRLKLKRGRRNGT